MLHIKFCTKEFKNKLKIFYCHLEEKYCAILFLEYFCREKHCLRKSPDLILTIERIFLLDLIVKVS